MGWFPIVWLIIFLVGLVVEVLALINKNRGDTLSEQVWILRTIPMVRFVLLPFWLWLTYHFWFEPYSVSPGFGAWWDDFIVIAAGAVAGLLLRYNKRTGTGTFKTRER